MSPLLQGKTALVTGGNRGIGFAICQGLLAKGFNVLLAARSIEKGHEAAERLRSPERVRVVELDADDDTSIHRAVEAANQITDHLDVLVNNAGIYPDEGVSILTISREQLNQTINTNTLGPIRVTQAFVPLLEKASGARVINVSSGYGEFSSLSANVPSYCLSKLALNGATVMLADALRPKNISVFAMCPGWVRTDMGGSGASRSPEEGADTAIWLATDASMGVSGKFFRDRHEISYC